MQFLLDNLAASLILSIILLMVLGVNLRTQEKLTETSSFYAMTKQGDNVIQILRRDMQGMEEAKTIQGIGRSGYETYFEFVGTVGTDVTPRTIRYTPDSVGTVFYESSDGTTKSLPVFTVTRTVDGVPFGGSGDIITDWEMTCLNKGDSTATSLDQCARVRVTFEAVPPIGSIESVPRMNWETTFHPPLLQD